MLAAEEFAMPAVSTGSQSAWSALTAPTDQPLHLALWALAGALAALLLARALRR